MKGKCAVCGKEGEVFVACSACGAISFAYCEDCLNTGAEPYGALVEYISCAGDSPEDINDTYLKIIRDTLSRLNITEEQFWKDVKQSIIDENEYLKELAVQDDSKSTEGLPF